ncbi:MAG TPA: hypothetical protein PKW45_11615 [Bryobacteraceae bacterium]|nr:hypothetical protein [Bryobacteraceae bacterium]
MRNQAQTTKQGAAGCYAARYAEAQDLLKRIAGRLAEHRKRQAAAPADWGYAGDLGRITEQLAYVLADLGDRSAVDAKDLEY